MAIYEGPDNLTPDQKNILRNMGFEIPYAIPTNVIDACQSALEIFANFEEVDDFVNEYILNISNIDSNYAKVRLVIGCLMAIITECGTGATYKENPYQELIELVDECF